MSFFTAIVYLFIEVAMKLFQLVTRKERVASAHAHPMEKAHQGDNYIDQRRES